MSCSNSPTVIFQTILWEDPSAIIASLVALPSVVIMLIQQVSCTVTWDKNISLNFG